MGKDDTGAVREEALRHHRAGRLGRAEKLYKRVLRARPDDADALNLLGLVCHALGRHERAAKLIRKALKNAPAEPHFLDNLAAVYYSLGRVPQAIRCLRRALEIAPDEADLHDDLGVALAHQGDVDGAIACYRRAIALNPGSANAHYNLGDALAERDDLEGAVWSFRRSLEIRPDNAVAWNNLGHALGELNDMDEAAACCRRAIAIDPDYVQAHYNLGKALSNQGQLDEAIACYRRAIAINPDDPDSHTCLGIELSHQGKFEEALAANRRALEVRPDFAKAYYALSRLTNFTRRDDDVAAMERLIDRPSMTSEQVMFLAFALAKAHEDLGDYETAFSFLSKANDIKRRTIEFDISEAETKYQIIRDEFSKSFLTETREPGFPSSLPVFIVGMPRSGTTLVEQILASHPEVHGGGERNDIWRIAICRCRELSGGRPFPQCVSWVPASAWHRLGKAYVAGLQRLAPAARKFIDKLPSNYRFIGLIHLIVPEAHIIHCVRDPVATCFSCYQQHFLGKQNFAYHLRELGAYYRLYDALMGHWREVLPHPMLEVRYEDIVADQEGETRRLLEFCGLEWNDACLEFHKNKRPVRTAAGVQVRQPVYRAAVGHWRRYEEHLGPLLEALGPLAEGKGPAP